MRKGENNSKNKILIIGYGSMGKKYENILKKKYEIFFYDKLKLKKKNVLKNLKNLKSKKFLFSVISTPANMHKYYAEIMVKNSINFLVEKPLSIKKDGWLQIIKEIKKKNLVCSVAYPRREGNAYKYIKKLIIKKKYLGDLKIIKTNYSQNFRKYRKDFKKIYYSSKKTGGGIVLDALTHHLNLISFLSGSIKNIKVSAKNIEIKEVSVPDTATMEIQMTNGVLAFIFGNQFQKPNIDEIELIGTKGNLKFERLQNKLFLITENKLLLLKQFKENYDDMFKKQISNYINSIHKKIPVTTNIEEEYLNIRKLI